MASEHRPAVRPLRGARPGRALSAVVAVLATVCLVGAVAPPTAWAFFAGAGGGTGQAVTTTLSAPGTPSATSTTNGGAVPVTWTAASLGTGRAPQGYYVVRVRTSDQDTAPACGTSAATLTTHLSCTDPGVADGSYRYRVVAVQQSWTAASDLSAAITVVNDTSLPTIAVTGTSPTANANGYVAASPVTATLTASPGAGGIAVASITAWVDAGTPTTTLTTTRAVTVSGDGTHVVSYYATDVLGRSSAVATYDVRIDRVAPAAPGPPALTAGTDSGRSSADGITNVTSPVLTGSAEAGATVTVYDGATAIGSGVAAGGTWTLPVTLAAGTHTLTAKATDLAGNTSASSSAATVVVDTTAPAAPATPTLATASDTGRSATDKITRASAPTFSGTSESAATVTLLDGTTTVATTLASGTAWSVATSTLGDGSHSIAARATDAAGNVSAPSAATTITVDTVAPPPPSKPLLATTSDTGISTSDGITKMTTPAYSGTTEKKAIVVLLVDGVTSATSGAVNNGSWSLTAAAVANGTHTVTATATDVAGNTSAASPPAGLTVDTIAPTATLDQAAGQADPAASGPVQFTAVFSEPVYDLTAADPTLGGTAGATTVAVSGGPTTYTLSVTGMTRAGTVVLSLAGSKVTDAAGNANTAASSTDNTVTYQ